MTGNKSHKPKVTVKTINGPCKGLPICSERKTMTEKQMTRRERWVRGWGGLMALC